MSDPRRAAFLILTSVIVFGTAYSVLYDTYLDTSDPSISHLPHPLSNSHYFARKSNFLNVYFIKKAWGWTSALFFLLWTTSPPENRTARRALKWAIATCVWIMFTMWFFGPSLLDRIIVASGGACVVRLPSGELATLPTDACFAGSTVGPASHPHFFSSAGELSTSNWTALPRLRKGHDVSGHVFLLTMSTLFLADQLLIGNLSLIGVWILASYTTSVYFHSPWEKVTGYLLGLAGFTLTQLLVTRGRSSAQVSIEMQHSSK
ncbi:FIT family protein scs3 [Leucoagaricus sp. SymC.cos]|nr:FIT family protein scs3 [Leucoagaricus sp. SymC.cos]